MGVGKGGAADKKDKKNKKPVDVNAAVAAASGSPTRTTDPKTPTQGRPKGEPKKGKLLHFTLPTYDKINEFAKVRAGGNASVFVENILNKYFEDEPL